MNDTNASKQGLSPVEAVGGGVNSRSIIEIASARIDNPMPAPASPKTTEISRSETKRISPYEDVALLGRPGLEPHSLITKSTPYQGSGFLTKLAGFFVKDVEATPRKAGLVKLVSTTDLEKKNEPEKTGNKYDDAFKKLEDSQKFAASLTLMSSLTQAVMSSARRLTQGQ